MIPMPAGGCRKPTNGEPVSDGCRRPSVISSGVAGGLSSRGLFVLRGPQSEASLCQPPIFVVCAGASGGAAGVAEVGVVGLVVGSGSDLSEEPAFQDVEPVTLDSESFLIVLPGPPHVLAGRRVSAINAR